MEISNLLLGFAEFKPEDQIVAMVLQQEPAQPQGDARALLIFQTRTQQTWLVATKSALYCVLDDVAKSVTRIQWHIAKEQLVDAGKQALKVEAHDKNERVGFLQIGGHKNWLYSKKLFTGGDVVSELSQLVHHQMDSSTSSDVESGSLTL